MTKKVGLIGYPIAHSLSPLIHRFFHSIPYQLFESKTLDALDHNDVLGVNITAPLKEQAFLKATHTDDDSKQTKSVNTLVKKEGQIYGFNTDVLALKSIIDHQINHRQPHKIAILGNGATSRNVQFVLKSHPHIQGDIFARHPNQNEKAWDAWEDIYDMVINTTPLGMVHSNGTYPFNSNQLKKVTWIFDAVYSPFNTRLLFLAKSLTINYQNGLIMLIKQARHSAELFTGIKIDEALEKEVLKALILETVNIVLIGMPYSGKTTFGKALANLLNRPFIDTDDLITSQTGKSPKEWLLKEGETKMRAAEKKAIASLASTKNHVIATGGGSILAQENVEILSKNGLIIWLESNEIPRFDESRPLSPTKADYLKLKSQRNPIYARYSDIKISSQDALLNPKEIWEEAINDYIHHQWT